MGTPWIIEGTMDPRWPIYTRGNIGEVFPEVITALAYELGVKSAERAWREAYLEMGIGAPGDFSNDDPVIIGLFGGYSYLNLSYLRMLGVRAPGSSAEAIDVAFFGEGDPPPYAAHPNDKNLKSSVRILTNLLKALGVKAVPEMVQDSFDRAAKYEALRPSLDASDEELYEFLLSLDNHFPALFKNHMLSTGYSAIVSGILSDACDAAGEPGLVTHLIGAAGDVRSAQYSQDLYSLSKVVHGSPSLAAHFDSGVDGLLHRLEADPSAAEFVSRFRAFLAEHGHRGPNDWETSSRTWDNTPELALVAIDRMRLTDRDLSPSTRLGDDDAKRQAAIAKVRPALNFLDKLNFDKAVKVMPYWAQAREATRDRAVRVIMPAKQVFRELVRRGHERGGTSNPTHVALLYPLTELLRYVKEPASMMDVVTERAALHERFSAVEPKFFLTSMTDVPTIEELEAEQTAVVPSAGVGEVLEGNAGSSGVARGRARVVLDPAEATHLEPGEVLVAPLTDPSWTPLFLPASAVVVNVGALMSHAVIVARELAIPCVVAVEDATSRITDGVMIEVDGTLGTVTIIED